MATWRSISSARAPEYTPPDWSITPIRGRSSADCRTGSRPRTRTVPESGFRYPSQVSTVVVLPAPLGPRTAVTPAPASRSRPLTAVFAPYRFTRAWTWTTGSLRMGPESRESARRSVAGVREPMRDGPARPEPPLGVGHGVRHREQPGVGRAHLAPQDGTLPLEVAAQVLEGLGADRHLGHRLPAAAGRGPADPDERTGHAVLGQVEGGAGAVSRAEQQDPGAQLLQTGQGASLAEPAVGGVAVGDLPRAGTEGREGGLRMRAAQGARPGAHRLRDHPDTAGGGDQGVVRRHGGPDPVPPLLGHRRVPPLGRVGEVGGLGRDDQGAVRTEGVEKCPDDRYGPAVHPPEGT
ncbi:hypothetical protein GPN2_12331 [Streptomyces murinus]